MVICKTDHTHIWQRFSLTNTKDKIIACQSCLVMISISLNLLLLFLCFFFNQLKKRCAAGKTLWSLPMSKAGYLKFCLMILVIIIARLYLAHQYQLGWLWPIFKVSIAKQLKMKLESCIVSLVIQTEFTVVMWKVIHCAKYAFLNLWHWDTCIRALKVR